MYYYFQRIRVDVIFNIRTGTYRTVPDAILDFSDELKIVSK